MTVKVTITHSLKNDLSKLPDIFVETHDIYPDKTTKLVRTEKLSELETKEFYVWDTRQLLIRE